jgi:hypothetical protein
MDRTNNQVHANQICPLLKHPFKLQRRGDEPSEILWLEIASGMSQLKHLHLKLNGFPYLPVHSWWKENFYPNPDPHELYSDYLERVL